MGQVSLTLNGRTFHLGCGQGEEARLQELAAVVRAKLDTLVAEFGKAGDERLLLMSALLIADEMLDAKARVEALEHALVALQREFPPQPTARAAAD